MPQNRASKTLTAVWKKLLVDVDVEVSREPETRGDVKDEDLTRHKVVRMPFDLEDWVVENNLSSQPPILFQPLAAEVLEMHPLRREAVTGSRWRAYIPPSKRDSEDLTRRWNISSCLLPVCDYLADMVAHSGRAELPWERSSLLAYCGLNRIVHPNPYLLSLGMSSQLEGVGSWTSQLELETAEDIGRPTHPHVTMLMQHDCNGREDTILYGELASLVSAMHARANQFMVEKEEMERVFDMGIGAYSDKPRIFSRETRFPVLQISFLGPQHARVLYACMDRGHIVIRQSKLYSFERDDEAPLDLFIRILASKPLPKQL